MKQWQINEWGKLAEGEFASQSLAKGQVRLNMRAMSLNYRDHLMLSGKYNPKQRLPLVPCSDGAGEIVEIGGVNDVFYRSRHAYTLSLLNAAPRLSAKTEALSSIPGSPPDLIEPPTGCKFHPRCAFATDRCQVDVAPLVDYGADQWAACHEAEQVIVAAEATRKVDTL